MAYKNEKFPEGTSSGLKLLLQILKTLHLKKKYSEKYLSIISNICERKAKRAKPEAWTCQGRLGIIRCSCRFSQNGSFETLLLQIASEAF